MLVFATENATQVIPWKAKELEAFEFKPTKYEYIRLSSKGEIMEKGNLDDMTDYIQGTFDDNGILGFTNDSYYLFSREDLANNTRYSFSKFNADFNKVNWSTLVESKEFPANMTSPNPLADLMKSTVKNLRITTAKASNLFLGNEGENHIIYGKSSYTALGVVIDDNGKYKGNIQLGAGKVDMLDKGKPTGSFIQTTMLKGANNINYAVIFEQRMVGGKKPEATADISPRVVKIDAAGKLTADQYYGILDIQLPILPTKAGTIGFFGDNKNGKVIWLCRVKFN
ncbi:MAG: hypothetical protein ACI81T_002024 [Bacteroidia bacterium]|jgi:hypothetical protein